jgi:FMN-binding domain
MRRAVFIASITVVGTAWILSYRIAPQLTGLVAGPVPSPEASPSGSPSPATTPKVPITFTGQDVPNRFGDVQVQIVITSGRITDVKALQLPFDRAQSAYISQVAGPMLRNEALQAQSARIDVISGATYTSQSYAQSLETALQQAHRG